jgi:glycosyltransferase involved in cell wall biosynthesis
LRRYRKHPHIELSPDAGRDALARALARARIGIHPFRGEHFGIGVAEMLCAGVLPVVHNSGGVCELVENPALRFDDFDDLVAKTAGIMTLTEEARAALLRNATGSAALGKALDFDRQLDRLLGRLLATENAA